MLTFSTILLSCALTLCLALTVLAFRLERSGVLSSAKSVSAILAVMAMVLCVVAVLVISRNALSKAWDKLVSALEDKVDWGPEGLVPAVSFGLALVVASVVFVGVGL